MLKHIPLNSIMQLSVEAPFEQLPLNEQAYYRIKKLILENRLKAGDQIKVEQLSKDLSLGRSPIYLALHRLERERLIEILPRKGILVKGETIDSLFKLLQARELIEPKLAYLATQNIKKPAIETLEKILQQSWECHENSNREGEMLADRSFHQCLYQAANNDLLGDFALQLLDRSMRLWFLPQPRTDKCTNSQELEDILKAIKAQDPECAAQKMLTHVGSIRKRFAKT